jgi:hypothetical protein
VLSAHALVAFLPRKEPLVGEKEVGWAPNPIWKTEFSCVWRELNLVPCSSKQKPCYYNDRTKIKLTIDNKFHSRVFVPFFITIITPVISVEDIVYQENS